MKLIRAPRQAGKTTTIINLSNSLEIPIAVGNVHEAKSIKRRAKKMGLNFIPEPFIFTIDNLRGRKKFLIDNLDLINKRRILKFGLQFGGLDFEIPFATYTSFNESVQIMYIIMNKGVNMPLPTPNEEETKEEFMSRCMSNSVMNEEFKDKGQRYSVCETRWEDDKEDD